MINNFKILLVGCGKMGGALLSAWLENGVDKANIIVVSPDPIPHNHVKLYHSVSEVPGNFIPDVMILAVKPQIIADIASDYKRYVDNNVTILSIAAGKKLNFLENCFGAKSSIVRTMPNLPATIGKGTTVAIANKNVSEVAEKYCDELLQAVGFVSWIDDENLMDAVTAISGSGPAYLFYFIETFIKAAEELGLSDELAKSLVYSTVEGSSLLAVHSEDSVSQLRENVTSPNGTTDAALRVLMENGDFSDILSNATRAAKNRSEELSL